MPKSVSICVPVYNTASYLRRCINSLMRQTHTNLEIVLVDDGSTDNSGMICDEYAQNDSRIRVVHKENGGEASARNAGLFAANGDYIMFCDSDDEYVLDAVEFLVQAMEEEDTDLAIGGYMEINGTVVHFATGHKQMYTPQEASAYMLIPTCTYGASYTLSTVNGKIFRRDLIIGNNILFDERFVIGNDTIFICDYIKHIRTVYDIFAPIYKYYKFHPSDRLQGMAWFYPDSFWHLAVVTDKLLRLAHLQDSNLAQLISERYSAIVSQLVESVKYENIFTDGLKPYLQNLCNINFIRQGAHMNLHKGFRGRIVARHIMNRNVDKLYAALCNIGKNAKNSSHQRDNVRLIVKESE